MHPEEKIGTSIRKASKTVKKQKNRLFLKICGGKWLKVEENYYLCQRIQL